MRIVYTSGRNTIYAPKNDIIIIDFANVCKQKFRDRAARAERLT